VVRRFLILGLIFWVAGCGARLPQTELSSFKEAKHPCRVAVLPFTNETKHYRLGRLVYRIFLTQLTNSKDFEVIEEGQIRSFLRLQRCLVGQEPPPRVLRMLGARLEVDAIIGGTVLAAGEGQEGVFLSFMVWAKDATSGKLLWNTYHSRTGEEYLKVFHFGRVTTFTRLAKMMVQEVVRDWEKRGLGGCR